MIRQSVKNVVYYRLGNPAALVVHGFHCTEHQRGMEAFAKTMGFEPTRKRDAYSLKRPAKPDAWFSRRAALLAPTPGSRVLSLGSFAGHRRAKQVEAIVDSPASYENFLGTFGGKWVNRTPLALEEPFLDLMAHSDMGLAVAFDHKDILVGGSTEESRRLVDWLSGYFRSGEARFIPGNHLCFALCDVAAASDLFPERLDPEKVPLGYEARTLRCDWQAAQKAA